MKSFYSCVISLFIISAYKKSLTEMSESVDTSNYFLDFSSKYPSNLHVNFKSGFSISYILYLVNIS